MEKILNSHCLQMTKSATQKTRKGVTVEVTNRFKRLQLIDRVPQELWTEVHDIVQEAGIKTIPNKKKCKKVKWLSEEVL